MVVIEPVGPMKKYTTSIHNYGGNIVYGAIFGIQYAICGNKDVKTILDGVTGDMLMIRDISIQQSTRYSIMNRRRSSTFAV